VRFFKPDSRPLRSVLSRHVKDEDEVYCIMKYTDAEEGPVASGRRRREADEAPLLRGDTECSLLPGGCSNLPYQARLLLGGCQQPPPVGGVFSNTHVHMYVYVCMYVSVHACISHMKSDALMKPYHLPSQLLSEHTILLPLLLRL